MTLDLTSAAVSDLQSISAYTLEKWGPRQEQLYLESLWAKFEEIFAKPEIWRKRNDLFHGCQIAVEGKHVILFRIERGTLQVVRILHSAMDFRRQIPKSLKGKVR